ncbi:MAG: acyltransferase, partial [Beijerinckiaceae bacterium]|nr:acyltransferase [Beijerinckiaceae bacterium]
PAFFLLPTRMWELGAGAALALLPRDRMLPPALRSGIWLFGIAGLAVSLLLPLPWPDLLPAATLAVLASCCLIATGGEAGSSLSARIASFSLAARPMVFIGLISYSLYLWHWPLIVLTKYYLVRQLTAGEAGLLFGASVGLAILSWRFIERPFRQRRWPIRAVALATASLAALVVAGSLSLLAGAGWPGRFSGEAARLNQAVGTHFRCPISTLMPFGASRACALHPADGSAADAAVVLLGNSHAQMYAPAWREVLAERGVPGLLVPVNGCLPVIAANISRGCIAAAKENLETVLALPKLRRIIIAMNWPGAETGLVDKDGQALDNSGEKVFIAALDDLVSRITAAGHRTILIGPIAYPGWELASEQSRRIAFGWPSARALELPQAAFEARHGAALAHAAQRRDIRLVRPDHVLCDGTRCAFMVDGRSLFADSNHLAAAETMRFRGLFREALDDLD